MSTTTTSIASVLNTLIETCRDGQEAFRAAAENVKSNNYRSLFVELATQRQLFVGELRRMVTAMGEEAQVNGSFGGTLRRNWMDLKAAVNDGDEHTLLADCEHEEDVTLAAYEEALEHDELPDHIRRAVKKQFVGVNSAHDRIRELRDRFQDKSDREWMG